MTFSEFKKQVNELVRSKKGALPDMNDWKRIKQMMDEVEETTTLSNMSYTISNNTYDWNGFAPSVDLQWRYANVDNDCEDQLSFNFNNN